jgi:hypothetical protein
MSNYSYGYHDPKYGVPDFNGHRIYKYGKGAHVGTHQAPSLYCGLGSVIHFRLDGKNKYESTAFNGFRFAVNKLRSATLSSKVRITPWISHKKFKDSLVRKSDLYQELIFHVALTRVDKFLLWNPKGPDPDYNSDEVQDKLVSDCLYRLDEMIGVKPRKTLIKDLVPWGADYVMTGMKLPSKSIWRFTPRLKDGEKISDFIIKESPATFSVDKNTIFIPGSKILHPKTQLSTQGVWVSAPQNAKVIDLPKRQIPSIIKD